MLQNHINGLKNRLILIGDSVFYSNRAACFAGSGQCGEIIADFTEALRMDPLPSTREPRPMRRDAAEGPLRFRRGRHHRWIQKRSRVGGDGEVAQEHVGGEDQGAAQGLSVLYQLCLSHRLLRECRLLNRHPPPSLFPPLTYLDSFRPSMLLSAHLCSFNNPLLPTLLPLPHLTLPQRQRPDRRAPVRERDGRVRSRRRARGLAPRQGPQREPSSKGTPKKPSRTSIRLLRPILSICNAY
ncbi:hypothetical protein BC936DRAFT_145097 [Jimgerdemannia flammicorona]|uniref:Uncharacterized protein n=1 Tax=Jimgerdemannia flammicorona TaxID=994334 RepID=A0A433DM05_9FUNG|nr:hypothetical protein BC936DRAFT_145097 [Jimgerdemannia flammicorona]